MLSLWASQKYAYIHRAAGEKASENYQAKPAPTTPDQLVKTAHHRNAAALSDDPHSIFSSSLCTIWACLFVQLLHAWQAGHVWDGKFESHRNSAGSESLGGAQ